MVVSLFSVQVERSFGLLMPLSGASLQEVAVDSDENILATDTVTMLFTGSHQKANFLGESRQWTPAIF